MTKDLDRLALTVGIVSELLTEGTSFGLLQSSLPGLRETLNRVMDDEDTPRQTMVKYADLLPADVRAASAECDEHAASLRTAAGEKPCPYCNGVGWLQ